MDADHAAASLDALAHADRLRAFRALVVAGPPGEASGRLAERLGMAPTRMSFHLARLERAGLVASRREGRRILYAARFEEMRALLIYLTEDCCGANPAICGLPSSPEGRS